MSTVLLLTTVQTPKVLRCVLQILLAERRAATLYYDASEYMRTAMHHLVCYSPPVAPSRLPIARVPVCAHIVSMTRRYYAMGGEALLSLSLSTLLQTILGAPRELTSTSACIATQVPLGFAGSFSKSPCSANPMPYASSLTPETYVQGAQQHPR